jgi:hypothetical protein
LGKAKNMRFVRNYKRFFKKKAKPKPAPKASHQFEGILPLPVVYFG